MGLLIGLLWNHRGPAHPVRRNEERYTGNDEERMQWLVYTLEAACALADAGAADGKMTWLIDFVGYTRKHQPPIKVTLHTLSLLQNHYPERLGLAVCFQPPLLFDLAWKVGQAGSSGHLGAAG